MTFIEFIGFIITFFAMVLLFLKRWYEERARQMNPQDTAVQKRREGDSMRKFYRTLEGIDEDEEEEDDFDEPEPEPVVRVRQPPPPSPITKSVTTQVRKAPLRPVYEVERQKVESRGGRLVHELKSKRDMVILREILDKPLAIREFSE